MKARLILPTSQTVGVVLSMGAGTFTPERKPNEDVNIRKEPIEWANCFVLSAQGALVAGSQKRNILDSLVKQYQEDVPFIARIGYAGSAKGKGPDDVVSLEDVRRLEMSDLTHMQNVIEQMLAGVPSTKPVEKPEVVDLRRAAQK